jgi:hypothetical protein
LDQTLTLEDYLVFQKKYFEETNKHFDETKYVWLATKSGTRLVNSNWNPSNHQLNVNANDLTNQNDNLGARPARCFMDFIPRFVRILSNLGSSDLSPEVGAPAPNILGCPRFGNSEKFGKGFLGALF